jgi:hypothetical protein
MLDYHKYLGRLRDYLRIRGIDVSSNNMCRCFSHLHDDKNPSCKIGKKHFHCFSCDTSGDIYDAVLLLENIDNGRKQFEFLENLFGGTDMDGIARIAKERKRQIEEEGYTKEHDLTRNTLEECARAAVCYALPVEIRSSFFNLGMGHMLWPWATRRFKPMPNRIRDLEKAGALIAAEIDRLLAIIGMEKAEEEDNHGV